ncbi:MAG: DUF2092 domain-containing protein [Capsulimonadaceae bacterium]|nr:DUF2092 domain-containing protein [Capsulimonadaceae bacterium]
MPLAFLRLTIAAVVVSIAPAGPVGAASRAKLPAAYAKMAAKVDALKSLSVIVTTTIEITPLAGGEGTKLQSGARIDYSAPNRLLIVAESMAGRMTIVSDGKSLYKYIESSRQYTAEPAPARLTHGLLKELVVDSLRAAGSGESSGIAVDIVKGVARTPRGKADITLAIGKQDSLPRSCVSVAQGLATQRGTYRVTNTQSFKWIGTNQAIPAAKYAFKPAAGASLVKSLPMAGPMGEGGVAIP